MDPASLSPAQILADQIQNLGQVVHELSCRVDEFGEQLQSPATSSSRSSLTIVEPKMNLPDRFSGDRKEFSNFQHSCKLYFRLKPISSGSESQRVGLVISLLQGDPQTWAFGLAPTDPVLQSVSSFFEALGILYDDPDKQASAVSQLRSLRQGSHTAEKYCTEFRRWAIDTDWNDSALRSQFYLGLSEQLKDGLLQFPVPDSLNKLMEFSIRIDRRLRERLAERKGVSLKFDTPSESPSSSSGDPEEPMQMGLSRQSSGEKTRRRTLGLCLYCAEKGHMANICPKKSGKNPGQVNFGGVHSGLFRVSSRDSLQIPTLLKFGALEKTTLAFIDSGAAGNFLDISFAHTLQIPQLPLSTDIVLRGLDGNPLSEGLIRFQTPPLQLTLGSLHSETLSFFLTHCPSVPIVLGYPWLQKHNPSINWNSGEVTHWGSACQDHCCSRPIRVCSVTPQDIPASSIGQLVPLSTPSKPWTHISLEKASLSEKNFFDRHQRPYNFKVGDMVWLSTKNIRLRQTSRRLGPKVIGPFPIIKQVNPVAFRLKLPNSLRISNTFHCSLLRPFVCSHRFGQGVGSKPAPVQVQGNTEFPVEKILDSKISRGQLFFLVHWLGYGPEERSWVADRNLHAPRLKKLFFKQFPCKPGSRGVLTPSQGGGTVSTLPGDQLIQHHGPRRVSVSASPEF